MKNILKNLHEGPSFGLGTYVSRNCSVIGKVILGDEASVWYGAVIRGDIEPVTIGARSNIQDGAIIHVSAGKPVAVGAGVSVGHGASLHGCTIGDNVLIGIGAIILDGAVVEENCIVAAGSLIPPGKIIPSGSMVMGSPGKTVRPLTDDDILWVKNNAAHYVEYKNIYLSKGF